MPTTFDSPGVGIDTRTDVSAARQAAIAAVRHHGLPTQMSLLRCGSHVVFELASPSLIVRCAPPGAGYDPSPQVTLAAEKAGLPVSAPAALPVTIDGWTITFWPKIRDQVLAVADSWRWVGAAINRVHSILDPNQLEGLPNAVGALAVRCQRRLNDVAAVAGAATANQVERQVNVAADAIQSQSWTPVVVHGDARPGNLVGAELIDWESAGLGPACLDHATAAVWARRFGEPDAADRFAAGYGTDQTSSPLFEACITLTELACVTWMAEQAAGGHPDLVEESRGRFADLGSHEPARPWWNG